MAIVTEVEPDDLVVGGHCLFDQGTKTPAASHSSRRSARWCRKPEAHKASASSQVHPVTQADEDPLEADPIGRSRPMTTQRVGLDIRRDQGLDGRPDGIDYFGLEPRMMMGYLHCVVVGVG